MKVRKVNDKRLKELPNPMLNELLNPIDQGVSMWTVDLKVFKLNNVKKLVVLWGLSESLDRREMQTFSS